MSDLKSFKDEVNNGRPRMALEHAYQVVADLVKRIEKLEADQSDKDAPIKKAAAKKTAAKKDEDETEEK